MVALFTALLAPMFVDWQNYKTQFEREASRIAGQPVRVNGDVGLRILPLPTVNFEGLEVGRNRDGSALMTVDRFSLVAELMPFLSGEVRIVEMSMLRPKLNLKIEEDGTVAWTSRQELLLDPLSVTLDDLKIRDGSISIDGLAGGRQFNLSDLRAEVSASSLLGPWRIDGDAVVEGVDSSFRISTGTLQESGSLRLKIEATRADLPYRTLLDGPVELANGVLQWEGQFKASARQDTERFSAQPLPVRVDGKFLLTPNQVQVPEYRLEVGAAEDPYVVSGEGRANIRDEIFFIATADGRQIDLDRLGGGEQETAPASLDRRLAALRSVIERIPVPGIDGEIDIKLPALIAGDTFIRQVAARVRPLGAGWELRSLSAKFPGDTELEAQGRFGLGKDFGFTGNLLIASRQPSGFASWVTGSVDPVFRQLRTAGLNAQVTFTESQATFENLELILGPAKLSGTLQRLAALDGQPGIVAKLEGDEVDLGILRAIYSLFQGEETPGLAEHDFDVELKAGRLRGTLFDTAFSASGVGGHVQVRGGKLSVESLQAEQFYGAKIRSSGRIENLLQRPNGNMKLVLEADHASKLLELGQRFGARGWFIDRLLADPSLTRNTLIELEVDTRARDEAAMGTVLWRGEVGGTFVEGQLGYEGVLAELPTVGLRFTGSASNVAPEMLLRQMGFDTLPLEAAGALKLNAQLDGSLGDGFEVTLSGHSPEVDVSGHGKIHLNGWQIARTNVDITLGAANLAPIAVVAGIQVPGVTYESSLPVSAKWKHRRQDGNTNLSALDGQLAGNRFNGDILITELSSGRNKISGDLRIDRVSFPWISEFIFGTTDQLIGEVSGLVAPDERWDRRNFSDPLYSSLDAELEISAGRISLGKDIEAADGTLKLRKVVDSLDVSDVEANLFDGTLSGGIALQNQAGIAVGSARFALEDADPVALLVHFGLPEAINGRVSASGTLESSGRSLEGLVSEATGNGVVKLSDGRVRRIDPRAFGKILRQVDTDGFEIKTKSIEALVADLVLRGSATVGEVEAAFNVARGLVEINNLAAEAGQVDLAADLEASLLDASMKADVRVRYDAGKEALVGADPEIGLKIAGPLGASELTIDVTALEGYLSLRDFEKNQRRIEILEAAVIEQQRLRRELRLANLRILYRERQEAEARRQLEEQLRKLKEEEERVRKENARKAAEEAAQQEEELQNSVATDGSEEPPAAGPEPESGQPNAPKPLFDWLAPIIQNGQ